MFRHRRQLRRWAAQVLMLWLFGIGSAVAHACVAPALPAPQGLSSAGTAGQQPPQQPIGRDASTPCHPDGPGRTNCQDFCDQSERTLPSTKPAQGDVQGQALALSAMPAVLPTSPLTPARCAAPRQDGVPVSSITIVFLRLTL